MSKRINKASKQRVQRASSQRNMFVLQQARSFSRVTDDAVSPVKCQFVRG